MPDIDQTVALDYNPAPAAAAGGNVIGSLASFAQIQNAQAQAALTQQNTAFAAGKNQALLDYQGLLQAGNPPDVALQKSGLGGYDPQGAQALMQNVQSGLTIAGERGYAANPGNVYSAAAGGPELVNKAVGVQQGLQTAQGTALANSSTRLQQYGQLGTIMANDPSPAGRAQAQALAQSIGADPGMIQQFMSMPDQQYVLAGQHFVQASMTPEKYMDVSGAAALNKGQAEAATAVENLPPGNQLQIGAGAAGPFQRGFTPGLQVANPNAAAGVPAVASTPAAPSALPPSAMTSSPLYNAAGQQYGVSPSFLARTAQIESNGNPNAIDPGSKAAGLFQFEPPTWKQYGEGSPFDPNAATDAAARMAADNQAEMTTSLGRPPTDAELYLAHQQGVDGALKLITNPNAPAGQLVGAAAIRSNGGDPNAPASAFINQWTTKFNGPGNTIAPSAVPAPAVAAVPANIPASVGTPLAGLGPQPARPAIAPPPANAAVPWAGALAPAGQGVPGTSIRPGAPAAAPLQLPAAGPVAAPAIPTRAPLAPAASVAGPVSPVAPAPATPGQAPLAIGARYTPETLATAGKVGAALGDQYAVAQDNYQQAQSAQLSLNQLQRSLSTLPTSGSLTDALLQPGAGAVERLGLAKAVNTAVTAVGAQPVFDPDKIAAAEESQKITGKLGFASAAALGQREAAQVVEEAIAQNPGITNTPQGARMVAASINAGLQRQKDYYQFLTQWQQQPGPGGAPRSLLGADVAFDQANPVAKYVGEAQKLAQIPQQAIDLMQRYAGDPRASAAFDQTYGPGMARYYGGQ